MKVWWFYWWVYEFVLLFNSYWFKPTILMSFLCIWSVYQLRSEDQARKCLQMDISASSTAEDTRASSLHSVSTNCLQVAQFPYVERMLFYVKDIYLTVLLHRTIFAKWNGYPTFFCRQNWFFFSNLTTRITSTTHIWRRDKHHLRN